MIKKLLLLILIHLITISAGVFLSCSREKEVRTFKSPAITVVPDDAVWIIESQSLPELLKAWIQFDPLFSSLQQIKSIQPFLQAFRKIDSLITRNSRYNELYAHKPTVVSLHQTGKNQYQLLVILESQNTSGSASAGDLFTDLCGQPGQWSQRSYNGSPVSRISFGEDALIPGVSFTQNSKYLLLSPSPILIENAVRQMNQESGLYNSQAFSQRSTAHAKSPLAKLYVNLKTFPTWMSGWMNPLVKRKMEMFTRYGDWASLDLSIRKDAIGLNGFALEGDTLNSYLNLFKNQEPRKPVAEKYLPSTTAVYFSLVIEKPGQYLRDLSDFLAGGESGRKRQRLIDKAVALTKADLVKDWTDPGFTELTIGFVCGVADESSRQFVLIEVKGSNVMADRLIGRASKNSSSKSNRQLVSMKTFRLDDKHEFALYPMPYEGLPEILGGSFFSGVSGKYFTFIGNVLVLADEIQTLEDVVHKYSLNKTLANDAIYQSIAGLISTRSNVTFFAIPQKAGPLLQKILNPKASADFFANDQLLLKAGAIGLQFNSNTGMLEHNVFASFAEIDYSRPQTIWESKLEAKVCTRPVIVTNHLTQSKEIMVQDEALNLYLMNSSGRILWKKNVGERINSEIFQVDVMKNGRLQYLFSTGKAIHLLDRNGAYLPKFPIKLTLPATNGMALLDMDQNRDYRILIACSDNKIYGFDKNGKPLKGWKFGPATGPITKPVQYYKIQNKDYLVFSDPAKVFILDRKGSVKVKPGQDFSISSNNRIEYEAISSGKGSRFLLTDVDGTVYSILLDGTIQSKKFGDFSPDHYFKAEDVNRDGVNEFIFIDHNRLEIFRQTGEKLTSRKFTGNVTSPPCFVLLSSNLKKIGLTIPSKNEILLIDSGGTPCNGFPLNGQTPFTTGNLEKATAYQNLLVGGDDGYLYNYAIK